MLRKYETVAVVGMSADRKKDSHHVATYLGEQGYRIFPVNPKYDSIDGRTCYDTLSDLPEVPDIVDVFLHPKRVVPIAREAVELGAKVLWLQEGVINNEAGDIAKEGGLEVVMNRCMLKEHRRLIEDGPHL